MWIVTGGCGFIGSSIIAGLNARGITDILAVDDLKSGQKFLNLADCKLLDYLDKDSFRTKINSGYSFGAINAILHQGACSDTMEYDGVFMMENNYEYSKDVLRFAQSMRTPLVYASTAATYGASTQFIEREENERPLNIYGWSKLMFDRHVRARMQTLTAPVVALRHFNVYGAREGFKGKMASVIYQFHQQCERTGVIRMFEGSGPYAAGEQRRDFVSVADLVKINLHFAQGKSPSGVYNAGTGKCRSFNEVGRAVIAANGKGSIEYIPFPEGLKEKYQNFTEADLTGLRKAGYTEPFVELEAGVLQTVQEIKTRSA